MCIYGCSKLRTVCSLSHTFFFFLNSLPRSKGIFSIDFRVEGRWGRGRWRDRERGKLRCDRDISIGCLRHVPYWGRDWTGNQVSALDCKLNPRHSDTQADALTTEPHRPGLTYPFLYQIRFSIRIC